MRLGLLTPLAAAAETRRAAARADEPALETLVVVALLCLLLATLWLFGARDGDDASSAQAQDDGSRAQEPETSGVSDAMDMSFLARDRAALTQSLSHSQILIDETLARDRNAAVVSSPSQSAYTHSR